MLFLPFTAPAIAQIAPVKAVGTQYHVIDVDNALPTEVPVHNGDIILLVRKNTAYNGFGSDVGFNQQNTDGGDEPFLHTLRADEVSAPPDVTGPTIIISRYTVVRGGSGGLIVSHKTGGGYGPLRVETIKFVVSN